MGKHKSDTFHDGFLELHKPIAFACGLRQRPQATEDETRLQIVSRQIPLRGFAFIGYAAS
jgi:hypothetical protein